VLHSTCLTPRAANFDLGLLHLVLDRPEGRDCTSRAGGSARTAVAGAPCGLAPEPAMTGPGALSVAHALSMSAAAALQH
jgi:hypothetical protein